MNTDRDIRRSIMAWAKGKLQTPPAGKGLQAGMTVYSEDNLRAVQAGTLTPVSPRVFLIDSYLRPTEFQKAMPAIVVESKTELKPFEVGNREGRTNYGFLHVFGRTRGERDDLSSFLANCLATTALSIYSFDTTGGSTFVETATMGTTIGNEQVPLTKSDLRIESSLDMWNVVSFSFMTLS